MIFTTFFFLLLLPEVRFNSLDSVLNMCRHESYDTFGFQTNKIFALPGVFVSLSF